MRDRYPFRFRKVDGVWQRRPSDGSEPWRTLRVEQVEVGRREKYRQRDGTVVTVPVLGNVWSWE